MLDPEDQTDGGPPNDAAVELFLRREGRYSKGCNEAGRVMYAEPIDEFNRITWNVGDTNIAGYEDYMEKWGNLKRSMYQAQLPTPKQLATIKCWVPLNQAH